jgi:hypothetical protein
MNRTIQRQALGLAMILEIGLAAGTRAQTKLVAEVAAPGAVSWLYLTPDCAPASPDFSTANGAQPRIVHCGATGSFVLGGPDLHYHGNCRTTNGATETPAVIPVERTPPYPPAFPCRQRSCDNHTPGHPWVAVVDWPTEHGWSVEATIREASDQLVETQLFDVTAAGALDQWVPSVSDLHVLVQLCAVAEGLKTHPGDRPLAVNMSFGRRVTEGDCNELGPTLGCAVGRVLSDLAGAGVLPVAAAGNHHEMLFPASSPGVVSAGALDLSRFEQRQEARPSAQTPDAAAALMLGYGLYLSADGKPPYWAAPPGSSYAAAFLTGWLGGTLAGGGRLPDPPALKGAHWAPSLMATTVGGLTLALNGAPLPGSALTGPRLLLERAMSTAGPAHDPRSGITLAFQGPAPPIPELSVLHADDGYGPQPGVDPCVPCGGGPPARLAANSEDLTIDLSSSGGLPAQMDLVAVFLRVGKEIYCFEGSRDPSVLAALAAGTVDSLTLSEIDGEILQNGEQPSLVLVINVGGLAYWHEVPIHLPAA